jgi:zinc transporter 1/2/3
MASTALNIARLVLRQDEGAESQPEEVITCGSDNEYDGRMGTRISSIFVILVASSFGMYNTSLPSPHTNIAQVPCSQY